MLRINIKPIESFNETTQEFEEFGGATVDLEHSLASMSKWESKYEKPFLSPGKKESEQILDYIRFMVVTPNLDLDVLDRCSAENFDQIQRYIDSSQTATTFGKTPERRGPGEVITAELIYFWMINFNIPWEAQYWHLNKLMALVRVCNNRLGPKKKVSRREAAEQRRAENAKRRAEWGTSG